MRMTDSYKNLALVLIVISRDGVYGRVSVPLDGPDQKLTAKELTDEFCSKFNGETIHHGTRSGSSVCDFQLNKSAVNEDGLKEVIGRIENVFSN